MIILLLFGCAASAQIVSIPDPNFKNALVNTLCVDLDHNGLADADADTNNDGEIDVAEALAVTDLYVMNRNISNLAGLEAFTVVEVLNIGGNPVYAFDPSPYQNLKDLLCGNNQLSSLNVSTLPNLETLDCSDNPLTDLTCSNNPSLRYLRCNYTLLITLNLCSTGVRILNCSENPNLTSISIKNGVISDPAIGRTTGPPPLPSLQYENCPSLSTFCYDAGEESAIETAFNSNTGTPVYTTDCECALLKNAGFAYDAVKIWPNPVSTRIMVNSEVPFSGSILNSNGEKVLTFRNLSKNQSLDVSMLACGVYLMRIDNSGTILKFIKN